MGLLWIGSLFPASSQSTEPTASSLVACSLCRGAGQCAQACLMCDGDGEIGCPRCNPSLEGALDPLRNETITPEQEVLLERVQESTRAMQDLLRGGAPVGHVRCPAGCLKGRPLLMADAECKYCAGKGGLPCSRCSKKGVVKCLACAGRGQTSRTCEACNGAKSVPDPKLASPELRAKCPWCADERVRACFDCETGRITTPCPFCAGAGTMKCISCIGTKSAPCRRCYSTGFIDSPLTGRSDCSVCHRTGRVECTQCQAKGVGACGTCYGSKFVQPACSACGGDRKRPCLGCVRGSVDAWERTAERLEKAGDIADAVGWLEGARAHCERIRAEAVAVLERVEAGARKALEDSKGPNPPSRPAGSDGMPLDLEVVQKLLDGIPLRKKAIEERHHEVSALLERRIGVLRAKEKAGH